jgi:hypothetical protein
MTNIFQIRKINLECAKTSCVFAAESTDIKIKGLTVNVEYLIVYFWLIYFIISKKTSFKYFQGKHFY